jgi:hypothetical protein
MTVAFYQIPTTPWPRVWTTSLLNVTYTLRTRWSNLSNCWMLDISDVDNNLLIGSIPLVTGADLLEQYQYLEIGGGLIIQNTSGPPDTVPGYSSLGVTSQLLFFPY